MENKKEIYIDTITGEELTKKTNDASDVFYYNSKNQRHRTDGPAIEYKNGSKSWYQNGKFHRVDGPAREQSGTKSWYQNDKRHNLNGPAIEWYDGTKEYYINGKDYTELEFNIIVRKMKMENL